MTAVHGSFSGTASAHGLGQRLDALANGGGSEAADGDIATFPGSAGRGAQLLRDAAADEDVRSGGDDAASDDGDAATFPRLGSSGDDSVFDGVMHIDGNPHMDGLVKYTTPDDPSNVFNFLPHAGHRAAGRSTHDARA